MPRYFSLSEAERLLPEVEQALRRAISLKSEYQEAEDALEGYLRRLGQLGGAMVDHSAVTRLRSARDDAAERVRASMDEVQELGCEVKDLDVGLIDFRTHYRGQEVYLCWKLGEQGISHWHGLQEGFRGRKEIDLDFRENHQGERRH